MTTENMEMYDNPDSASPSDETRPLSGSHEGPQRTRDTKRVLACGTCRKRKLKCDSKRPKCSTCARLGHPCEYDEVRKKSGPKRGYVKSLEARLNQLENLLEQNKDAPDDVSKVTQNISQVQAEPRNNMSTSPAAPYHVGAPDLELGPAPTMNDNDVNLLSDMVMPGGVDFSWDMISLGLEEPLPSQDVMDELYQLYFAKVHPSLPMLHRPRFMSSLTLGPNSRPPVCLKYIMWANACSVSPKYVASAEQFYTKARKYLEKDEMSSHGESFITVAHAQSWVLVACYEFKYMYFPRAWVSVGRATRLVQMMGLHRQDRVGLDVKQTLAPPRDWTEREERRRTFWLAYCHDRYASIGTGWPMTIDEQDILTNLPASDEAFFTGNPEQTSALADIMKGDGVSGISSLAGVVLLATLFGRNLTHLHRPSEDDNDHDLGGEFWKRHRSLDNIILNTSLSLPGHLRLPQGISDPKIVNTNMNIHTATICLHQAAIFKADKHKLASQISIESKRRCLVAADQIANLMRMVSHQDLTSLNPFSAFCLYVAARVFVQYLKFKKNDHTVRSSLIFLLHAMNAMKVHNPLTESFLVQLDVDLEGCGINIPITGNQIHQIPGETTTNYDNIKCSPLFEIRSSQVPMPVPSQASARVGNRPDSLNGPLMSEHPTLNFDDSLDQNPYFTAQDFDNGAPDHGNGSQNGLTPSFSHEDSTSRSHSGHPTPNSMTNASSAYSPSQTLFPGQQTLQHNTGWKDPMKPVSDRNGIAGAIPNGFHMSPTAVEHNETINHPDMHQHGVVDMNLDQFNVGVAGMSPGNMADASRSGMTPNFVMTPMSEWQTMNNMNMDENNAWMFPQ